MATLQSLYNDNLLNQELNPEIFNDIVDILTKQGREKKISLDTLIFILANPDKLLYRNKKRFAWCKRKSQDQTPRYRLYIHEGFCFFQPLNITTLETIDELYSELCFSLTTEEDETIFLIEPDCLPDDHKQFLSLLSQSKIINIDAKLMWEDLRECYLTTTSKLQLSIKPLTNKKGVLITVVGEYLYLATNDRIWYYPKEEGLVILETTSYTSSALLSTPIL